MKISDFVFARNAPSAFHRPLIVISVIICVIWSAYFADEMGFPPRDLSKWFTYFIGLIVAAFVAPTALGIYFYLPALGKNRKWEKLLLIAGPVLSIGLMAYQMPVMMERSGYTIWRQVEHSFDDLVIVIFVLTFVPIFAFKILVWLWQGVRRQGK